MWKGDLTHKCRKYNVDSGHVHCAKSKQHEVSVFLKIKYNQTRIQDELNAVGSLAGDSGLRNAELVHGSALFMEEREEGAGPSS